MNIEEQSLSQVTENKLKKQAINVHKFGGSSLASTQCIERVVDIISSHCQLNDMVVVSANGKTTDQLFALFDTAVSLFAERESNASQGQSKELNIELAEKISLKLALIEQQQISLIKDLLSNKTSQKLISSLTVDITQLAQWLKEDPLKYQNDILAFGEKWSANLLSAVLNEKICPSYSIDARDFLVLDSSKTLSINYPLSAEKLQSKIVRHKLAVVTGYISKNENGITCTLGRNGSDYSATIMAALVAAKNVTLWTDVDGIYSADPRVVPNARKLHRLPNGVARELGRLGNPVLHAKTLSPLTKFKLAPQQDEATPSKTTNYTAKCHLHVASSFDTSVVGTEIGEFGQIAKQELSVTYLNDLLLAKLAPISNSLSQYITSKYSPLCIDETKGFVVITQAQKQSFKEDFNAQSVEVSFNSVSLIATVGHKVALRGDIKARFKRSLLNKKTLSVIGSSNQHSLIAILSESCDTELLNYVHHNITKDTKNIGIVVAGLGNIGQRFLEILPAQLTKNDALENTHLVGLISSTKSLIKNDGIDVSKALSLFSTEAEPYDKDEFLSWLNSHPYDELVVIDITPSESFSLLYQDFFALGIHVIGANKWAASSSTEHYKQLLNTAQNNNSLWLGNTTVGAGLPINYAISDLEESGDTITAISGIFSGTLSWLFETYDGRVKFSTLLLDALSQGITEPDPREDLSGRDVQRKLLILARMAGFELSIEDIPCNNLVPEHLQNLSTDEFLKRAHELDDFFSKQLKSATQKGACIRYVAQINNDTKAGLQAEVGLQVLPKEHAFSSLTPCDNIFQIESLWYQDNPLIIRGPGAGRDVTAAGLHSDLVKLCKQLANKLNQVKIKGVN
ncbi:MAG: bifunctional aspartate kinase/homoserine dehydrogenase II [Colwellia sp.]